MSRSPFGATMQLWPPLPADAVTSPARTAVDIACRRPPAESVPVLAVLGFTTGLRPGQVHGVLAGLQGRPGVRRARAATQAWAGLLGAGYCSVDAVAGDPVRVEDALDLADGVDDVVEVTGRRHLEGEPGDRDAVA